MGQVGSGEGKVVGEFCFVDVNDRLRGALLCLQPFQGCCEPVLWSMLWFVLIDGHRGRTPLVCLCVHGG